MADSIPGPCGIRVELGIAAVAQLVLLHVQLELCHVMMETFAYS